MRRNTGTSFSVLFSTSPKCYIDLQSMIHACLSIQIINDSFIQNISVCVLENKDAV